MDYDINWAKVDPSSIPDMKFSAPGPKSKEIHDRAEKYMKGDLAPVVYRMEVKIDAGKVADILEETVEKLRVL